MVKRNSLPKLHSLYAQTLVLYEEAVHEEGGGEKKWHGILGIKNDVFPIYRKNTNIINQNPNTMPKTQTQTPKYHAYQTQTLPQEYANHAYYMHVTNPPPQPHQRGLRLVWVGGVWFSFYYTIYYIILYILE